MSDMNTLVLERHEQVLLVRLNRNQRRNAINLAMLDELDRVLDMAERDGSVRALVLTGDEKAFCAGQDLKEAEPPEFEDRINGTFDRLEALPKPTVAAIDGWCIAGGLELALVCDHRICSTEARIGDWHANIDSIGGAGATVRLVRTIGLPAAKALVFSGATLDAAAAQAAGLVASVHPRPALLAEALAAARSFTRGSPETVRFAKLSMQAASSQPLEAALAFARLCQARVRSARGREYAEASGSAPANG